MRTVSAETPSAVLYMISCGFGFPEPLSAISEFSAPLSELLLTAPDSAAVSTLESNAALRSSALYDTCSVSDLPLPQAVRTRNY